MRHTKALGMVISAGLLFMLCASPGSVRADTTGPVPVIHVTDLFRPHIDPDDHWDLACVYALAHRGDIDLRAVLIDYPPAGRDGHDPDIAAVAQMNRITGLAVPVAVGSPVPMKSQQDTQSDADAVAHQGARFVLDTLRTTERPVVINVTGSSRDIAIAGRKAPDLFAQKCAAVYLNAGMGSPDGKPTKVEYNVTLGRVAYAAIFDLPCPVYWMPCFEGTESKGGPLVREYATHYKFRQRDILPHLSNQARNYFAFMFGRYENSNWLRYLQSKPDRSLLDGQGAKDRHMWCTAGFLHAAGYVVAPDGQIRPRDVAAKGSVFTFDPIQVSCDPDGLTKWSPDPSSTNRFIFHVRDRKNYEAAMTKAMRSLLETLP